MLHGWDTRFKKGTLLILVLFFLIVTYNVGVFLWRVQLGKGLVDRAERFENIVPQASYRILVIGDSTAVGTGVRDPGESIAGQLSRDFPHVSITNRGENGQRISELRLQLEEMQGQEFDLIILHGGGNDIVRFANRNQLQRDMKEVLMLAKTMSNDVVLITSGNIGLAPIFPWPFSAIISARTQSVHKDFVALTQDANVLWVPLYTSRADDPFAEDIDTFYAADKFHPAARGYHVWYNVLRKTLDDGGVTIGG